MEPGFKNVFSERWDKYFPGAEYPIGFFYSSGEKGVKKLKKTENHRCLIADLSRVRKGTALCCDKDSIGCAGGVRCAGFPHEQSPYFNYFLSCGLAGKVEGIRYKKTPQLVKETQSRHPAFVAPDDYLIFKPWDLLEEEEIPVALIFFVTADLLAGLFSLANYDEADPMSVLAPSCAGCASIVQYPYLESEKAAPRCILGMFDISARPFVQGNVLTFSIPWKKFRTMVENMDESFLIKDDWSKIRRRLNRP